MISTRKIIGWILTILGGTGIIYAVLHFILLLRWIEENRGLPDAEHFYPMSPDVLSTGIGFYSIIIFFIGVLLLITDVKFIFAFIINFIILGGGFVVLTGIKGLKLALLYWIPFLALHIFSRGGILTSKIIIVLYAAIYVICYIHLYKVYRSSKNQINNLEKQHK